MREELEIFRGFASEEELNERLEKGRKEGVEEVASKMLVKKFAPEDISYCTGLTLPQIETLAASLNLA